MLTAMRALVLIVGITTAAALAATPPRQSQPQAEHQPQRAAHEPQPHSPHGQLSKDDHIPKDQAADTYAIYSLLMPGKLFEHMGSETATRWAVAQETITFDEMNPRIDPRGALKPPKGNEKRFHQAVQDFETLKYASFTLQPKLHIKHAYDLLDPEQVRDLRHAKAGLDPDSRLQSRYAKFPGITFFSAVYFSDDQKAALVYVNDWCGVLCNQSQWVYLEKINGHWERKSGITVPGA